MSDYARGWADAVEAVYRLTGRYPGMGAFRDGLAALSAPPEDATRNGDACKTRTVHGCWCDLPNGHDGPHRSYDDPEPAPPASTGRGECARCGGTGVLFLAGFNGADPGCPACGGTGVEGGAK